MNEKLTAAIEYQKQGLAVFPVHYIEKGRCSCGGKCSSPGKHPATIHGVNDASLSNQQAKKWWSEKPYNIGISAGAVSGIFVIDIDGEEGIQSLDTLELLYGELPATVEQITGGGGKHLLFKHPGYPIKNKIRIHPGIDIRGDGGYIVVAPSNHISGNLYIWSEGKAPGEIEIAELPEDWQKLIMGDTDIETDPFAHLGDPFFVSDETIEEGSRNSTLHKAASSLRAKGFPESAIAAAIHELNNERCNPPLLESEVNRILQSVFRYQPGSLKVATQKFALNDFGLGERFVYYYGDRARYCRTWGIWLLWDGMRWKPDETGEVEEWGRQVIRKIPEEAAQEQDDDNRSKILKFAAKCCHRNYLDNMLRMAQTMPGIPVTPEQMDRDIWLLNCQNGTLNLKTGQLKPHDPLDMLTKITPVSYIPGAKAPTFMKFMNRIFNGNKDLISFIQRAAGYSLTGSTMEQVLFLCYGTGANGKSTMINTLCDVVGDYGTSTPMSTFIDRQAGAATNDIARMRGMRLITALETNKGGSLDEAVVKQLTGGDPVTARFLHKEFFEFIPTFKFWLGFNHRPLIKGTDYGIWRRIKLIPFEETISDDEKDKSLPDKLKNEYSGILNWMVQGCMDWQNNGLRCPQEVEAATEEYRSDMDVFGDFLKACCVLNSTYKVQGDVFYKRYQQYCWESGLKPVSAKKIVTIMKERGFQTEEGRSRRYFWLGLDLIPEEPDL